MRDTKSDTSDTSDTATETASPATAPTAPTLVGFDIDEADTLAEREEQGIDVEFEDALGRIRYQPDGTPMTITVVGSLSKRYRKVQEIQRGRIMKRPVDLAKEQAEEDDETVGRRSLDEQTEAAAKCCIRWSAGYVDKSGKPIPFTEKNVVRVLKQNPRMQRKLEAAMENHAAFFGQSSTSSGPR